MPSFTMTNNFPHLRDIDLALTSAKTFELHLHRDRRTKDKYQTVGLFTTLGWVLIDKKLKSNLSESKA